MKLTRRTFKQNSKLRLEISQHPEWDNKYWLDVTFLKSRHWIPRLEELGAMIRAIGWCEDKKYENGKGRFYLLDYLQDCLWDETTEEDLRLKYQIPVRHNNGK